MDILALDMQLRRRLITVNFKHRDTLARSQVSQEKKHDVKTIKISVFMYAINAQYHANTYIKISLREYRAIAFATRSFTD